MLCGTQIGFVELYQNKFSYENDQVGIALVGGRCSNGDRAGYNFLGISAATSIPYWGRGAF